MPANFETVSVSARAEQLISMFMEDHFVPDELHEDLATEVEAALLDLMGRYPEMNRQSFFYKQLEAYMEDWIDVNMREERDPHIYGPKYTPTEILILGGWADSSTCGMQTGGCRGCPIANICPLS